MKDHRHSDYLILGAGPAGLQLAYYLEKRNADYRILEGQDKAGKFFETYPRHRKLISVNKVYTGYSNPDTNLRWDWNSLLTDDHSMLFTDYSKEYFPPADDFVTYLNDYANRFDLKIEYGVWIEKISKSDKFELRDHEGNVWTCNQLIVATGKAKPYIPEIPGIEHAELYTEMSVDPDDFRDQRVLIIGKGNSGFETADNLIETTSTMHVISPNPLKLAWQSHYVGHLRAVNNNFLDTYMLKSQNTVLDGEILNIQKLDNGQFQIDLRFSHAAGQTWTLVMDRVILCTGFMFDDKMFDAESCPVQASACGKYPAMTSEWESLSTSDLYFAGVIMHQRDLYKTFSGFIHGFRYNVRALSRILGHKHEALPLPSQKRSGAVPDLVQRILDRINSASSLYQQPGFLGDMLALEEDGSVTWYDDVPFDYVADQQPAGDRPFFMLSMEFGKDHPENPFNIERDPDDGAKSPYLHPIVRYYEDHKLVAEHHVIEDLENKYYGPRYADPLSSFLALILEKQTATKIA